VRQRRAVHRAGKEVVPTQGNITAPLFPMKEPQIVGGIGDEWEPVSHNILPRGDTVLVSVFLRRHVKMPDTSFFAAE